MNTTVVIKRALIAIIFLTVVLTGGLKSFASSGDPVLVEAMGNFACAGDQTLQDSIKEIITNSPNVIFLNCKVDLAASDPKFLSAASIVPPLQHLCNFKKKAYYKRLEILGIRSMMFVINGSLDARGDHVESAVKASQSLQKVLKIGVTRKTGHLDVHLPDLGTRTDAKIYIYSVKPTKDDKRIFVDSTMEMTPDLVKSVKENPFQPFVTQKRISPMSVREAVAFEEVGSWDGQEMFLSIPLPRLEDLTESLKTMSYILVAQEDDVSGRVLAVGQYLSPKEISWLSSKQDVFSGQIIQISLPPNM